METEKPKSKYRTKKEAGISRRGWVSGPDDPDHVGSIQDLRRRAEEALRKHAFPVRGTVTFRSERIQLGMPKLSDL